MRFFVVALLAALAIAPLAQAQSRHDIAERVAAALRSAVPDLTVQVVGDDIDVSGAGQPATFTVQEVQLDCVSAPNECDQRIRRSVDQITAVLRAQAAQITPQQLLGFLRARTEIERMQWSAPGGVVSAPLAGELAHLCYLDFPTARRPVIDEDLTAMHIDRASALTTCKANTRAVMPALADQWRDLPAQGFGVLDQVEDAPNYLLFPEDWAALARRFGGLVVAAPGDGLVFYGRASNAIERDAILTITMRAFRRAVRPLSNRLYRWTENGWQELCGTETCISPAPPR